jgi:hypothetical protein
MLSALRDPLRELVSKETHPSRWVFFFVEFPHLGVRCENSSFFLIRAAGMLMEAMYAGFIRRRRQDDRAIRYSRSA